LTGAPAVSRVAETSQVLRSTVLPRLRLRPADVLDD